MPMLPRSALDFSPIGRSIAALASCLSLVAGLHGCGNAQLIDAPPPQAPAAEARPSTPDAYRDHAGPHAKVGEQIRLKDTAFAIDGAEVVVSLVRASWTKRTLEDGRVIRDGSAEISVSRGEETSRRILEQGEAKAWLGVLVTVKGAGEDYDEQRLDYIPWVELKVEPAP